MPTRANTAGTKGNGMPSLRTLGIFVAALGALGSVDAMSSVVHLVVVGLLILLGHGSVNVLFEHGLGLDGFELSLEVLEARGVAATVGAATSVGQVEALVLDFLAIDAPGMDVSFRYGLIWRVTSMKGGQGR